MLSFPTSTDALAKLAWRRGVAVSILACQAKGRGFKSRRLRWVLELLIDEPARLCGLFLLAEFMVVKPI